MTRNVRQGFGLAAIACAIALVGVAVEMQEVFQLGLLASAVGLAIGGVGLIRNS